MTTTTQHATGVSLGDLQLVLTYLADRPLLPMPDGIEVARSDYSDRPQVRFEFTHAGRAAFDAWVAEAGGALEVQENEDGRHANVWALVVKARGRRQLSLRMSWHKRDEDQA